MVNVTRWYRDPVRGPIADFVLDGTPYSLSLRAIVYILSVGTFFYDESSDALIDVLETYEEEQT